MAKTVLLPPPPPRPKRRNAHKWLLGVLSGLVFIVWVSLLLEGSTLQINPTSGSRNSITGALRQHQTPNEGINVENLRDLLPAWAVDIDDLSEVPEDERLHLNLLHASCKSESEAVITWRHGAPGPHQDALMHTFSYNSSSTGDDKDDKLFKAELFYRDDPNLLEKLSACPDIDIFLPPGLRGNGYCEDACAYAKYLNSRLLPTWAFEVKLHDPKLGREVDYFDLCPTTPVIFFNHYWLPDTPRWPEDSQKPLYIMPNIEMYELNEKHYWRADVVLCKTRVCYDRVTRWYKQEGNPRNAKVIYTRHTSSDQAEFARRVLASSTSSSSRNGTKSSGVDPEIAAKDFENIRFVHTAGSSGWKGTRQVVDCWLSDTGLPPLDLYMNEGAFDGLLGKNYKSKVESTDHSINVKLGGVPTLEFDKLVADTAFFLCPSVMEGYGHYMNQARASGAVIVTTDIHPMNELITSNEMGVLVPAKPGTNPLIFLGGNHKSDHGLRGVNDKEHKGDGLVASFSGADLCQTIKHMVETTTVDDRRAMAARAKQGYHRDTKFFARAMAKVRAYARAVAALAPSGSQVQGLWGA